MSSERWKKHQIFYNNSPESTGFRGSYFISIGETDTYQSSPEKLRFRPGSWRRLIRRLKGFSL